MTIRGLAGLSVAAIAAVLITCGAVRAAVASGGEQTWIVASDIHLDPFKRDSSPSLFGSDTNLPLFRSMLTEMKRDVPNPSMILLPGDFFAHKFGRLVRARPGARSADEEGVRTMRLVASAFGRAFPRAQFAIALGNNDTPCGDYRSALGSPYQAAIARVWAPLVDRGGIAPNFADSFTRTGSYAMRLPVGGLRLIVIDDVLFSAEYLGNCGDAGARAGVQQLTWLEGLLAATPAGQRNVVMMHIPPGYDAMTTQRTQGFVPWPFLRGNSATRLAAILSGPRNRVAYVVAGHAHRFDFRLDGGVPVLVFGAISPVYHNNPAFYALRVRADGSLRDIDTYAFDEWTQEWQPPRSFDAKWHVPQVDATTLALVHARLEGDPAMRHLWDAGSSGWPSNWHQAWGMWGPFWRIPWCAQSNLGDGFARCAGLERRAALFRAAVIAAFVCAIALAVVVAVIIWRALRRRALLRQS
jgi:hypothetical protein